MIIIIITIITTITTLYPVHAYIGAADIFNKKILEQF